jgi:hypothetical protein
MVSNDGHGEPRAALATAGARVADGARRSRLNLGDAWQGVLRRARAQAPATMVGLLLALVAFVLDGTPQGRDVVAAQFRETTGVVAVLLLALSLSLCSFVAWVVSRKAVLDAFGHDWNAWTPWLRQKWLLMMPRFLWAAPFVIVVVPLLLDPGVTWAMVGSFFIVWLLGSLVGVFLLMSLPRRRFALVFWSVDNDWNDFPWLSGIGPVAAAGFIALGFILWSKVEAARVIGAPALALFAIAFIIAMLGFLYHLVKFKNRDKGSIDGRFARGDVRFLPVLGFLAVWAAIWSWTNGNHEVANGRSVAMTPASRPALPATVKAFVAQLPLDWPPGRAVPIVFVATAGGASRAAYWTGGVLGAIEAKTGGRFSRNVFAISSVSGGTLGAATYLAERAENIPAGAMLDRMRCENGANHLSPAIAGLLFPDLLQRFIRLTVFPDRAEYLERSFAASWPLPGTTIKRDERGTISCPATRSDDPGNRFAQPMLDLWRAAPVAGPRPWVPVLLANGTRAEDGRRIVTTNVRLPPGTLRDALDFHDVFERDVPLSVAVTNSARFPIVSPSGTLPRRDAQKDFRGHIIDGGYFENGGIATVVELAQAAMPMIDAEIRQRDPRRHAKYIILEINNDDTDRPQDRVTAIVENKPPALPLMVGALRGLDVLLPVFGLYQTRSARGTLEAFRTRAAAATGGDYVLFQLCALSEGQRTYPTEMNWALSQSAKIRLNKALATGNDDGCRWPGEIDHILRNFSPTTVASPSRAAP